ncbi:unnamed protein product [Chrysoparadoxa australica]
MESTEAVAAAFLEAAQSTIEVGFQPSVQLPGDDVTDKMARTRQPRLGQGLIQQRNRVMATRAGMLQYKPPSTYWVSSNQKRYIPRVEDQVIGVVEDRAGDYYRVNISGSSPALLPILAFDGATKRYMPNLPAGSLVFARVAAANKDMEPQLTCCAPVHAPSKGWMTGQSMFGQLKGGKSMRCSALLAQSLVKPDCAVLHALGESLPYEMAVGANGYVWVNSANTSHTIAICNAIDNCDIMAEAQALEFVKKLLKGMGKTKK